MHSLPDTNAAPTQRPDEHLLVRVGGELFALPLGSVEEAVAEPELVAVPGAGGGLLGVIRWRGARVPVHCAHAAFGVRTASPPAVALVLRSADRAGAHVALAADELVAAEPLAPEAVRPWACRHDPHRVIVGVADVGGEVVAVARADAAAAALSAPALAEEAA